MAIPGVLNLNAAKQSFMNIFIVGRKERGKESKGRKWKGIEVNRRESKGKESKERKAKRSEVI